MPHQCTECGHTFPDGSKEMLSGCPDCGGTKFQFRPEGADLEDPDPTADPPEPPERPDSGVAGTVGKAASTVRDLMGGENAPEPRTASEAEAEADPDADAPTESEPATAADADSSTTSADQPAPEQSSDGPVETEDDDADTVDPDVPDDADAAEPASTAGAEDAAQASARSDVVSADELPDPGERDPPAVTEDRPDPEDGTVVSEPTGEKPGLDELREELNDQFESIKIVEPGQYELNLMELYDREEYIIALQEDGKYSIQVPENLLGGE